MNGKDIAMGLTVVVLWGLNFIAIKLGLQDMPPLLLGALRFAAATLPAVFFLRRPPVPWKWLIALGMSINVGQFAFLFLGIKLGMPAGLASLVLQAQAFFTLAVAVFVLGEKWRWNHVAGLMTAAAGMLLIALSQGANMTAVGFWLVLMASFSWGTGNIIMRRATQGVPPFSMLSLVVWAGAVAVLPLALLSLCIEGPGAWVKAAHSVNGITVASILYLAYFATLGGYGLWGRLLARHSAAVVSPFGLLVPVIGLSSSAVVLHEALLPKQIAGAVLVMLGLVIHIFGERWFRSKDAAERIEA